MIAIRVALVTDGSAMSSACGEDKYDYTDDFQDLRYDFASKSLIPFTFRDVDSESGLFTILFYHRDSLTQDIERLLSHGWITSYDVLSEQEVKEIENATRKTTSIRTA